MRILKGWGSSEVPISKFPIPGTQNLLSLPAMAWGLNPGRALSRASFGGRSKEVSANPMELRVFLRKREAQKAFPCYFDMNCKPLYDGFKPFYMGFKPFCVDFKGIGIACLGPTGICALGWYFQSKNLGRVGGTQDQTGTVLPINSSNIREYGH